MAVPMIVVNVGQRYVCAPIYKMHRRWLSGSSRLTVNTGELIMHYLTAIVPLEKRKKRRKT